MYADPLHEALLKLARIHMRAVVDDLLRPPRFVFARSDKMRRSNGRHYVTLTIKDLRTTTNGRTRDEP